MLFPSLVVRAQGRCQVARLSSFADGAYIGLLPSTEFSFACCRLGLQADLFRSSSRLVLAGPIGLGTREGGRFVVWRHGADIAS